MKQKIKSYLQIQDKYLGTLLYFKDTQNRGCIKLSFKNKITGFVKETNIKTNLPVPAKLDRPISLDISYKFEDSLFEVKKIIDRKLEREFYKIPLPISTYLFIIRIKDWHNLDKAEPSTNPLILTPKQSSSVAIVFSFLGTNGKPIAPKEYNCLMGTIDLPESPLSTFCIGIAEDTNNEKNAFIVQFPYPLFV